MVLGLGSRELPMVIGIQSWQFLLGCFARAGALFFARVSPGSTNYEVCFLVLSNLLVIMAWLVSVAVIDLANGLVLFLCLDCFEWLLFTLIEYSSWRMSVQVASAVIVTDVAVVYTCH